MSRIRLLLPLLGLMGTAMPVAAQQARGVHVPGFDQDDNFRFGISKEQVNSFWRETPDAERREGSVLQLDYDPWQFMNWTVMVHDQEGVIGFIATLQPTESARRCRQVFQALVRGMNEELRVQPVGRVTVGERDDLCGAAAGRRGEAGYHWHVPSTGVSSSVWVDPRDGLVHWVVGTSTMRQWAGPARDPLAFWAGTERAPQAAAPPAQRPAPQASAPAAQQPAAPDPNARNLGVTERALQAIRPGMSYQDIVTIIGREGTQTSSSSSGGTTIAGYSWRDGLRASW